MSRYYLTTAIDYSNGDPHLGHAYEKIGADAIARYHRLRGEEVRFLVGMDEHGQKVAQAAAAQRRDPQDWVDEIAERFRAAWRELAISNDDFIRTTEPRHAAAVHALLQHIRAGGHVFAGTYAGWYCVGCEAFKLDKELAEGRCPEHPSLEVRWTEEENHFFRLSAFREPLLAHFEAHPDFLAPTARLNEVRRLVSSGLEDLSVSRSRLRWGIPFPDSPDHIVYVWVDALINYLSATGFPEEGYQRSWPADLHVIGPDITRFHCVVWPAMLLAAGLSLPRRVWAHGWIQFEGTRFSKTAGVPIALPGAVERHGPDALRYFVLREVPWDASGSFTLERFDAVYTAELADAFGNLVSRVLAMLHRYRGGTVPAGDETALDRAGDRVVEQYRAAMDSYLLHQGLWAAWQLVAAANAYVEREAPWALAKSGDDARLDTALAALSRALARLSVLISPFMPHTAAQLREALGAERAGAPAASSWSELEAPHLEARLTHRIPPLFPKGERIEPTA